MTGADRAGSASNRLHELLVPRTHGRAARATAALRIAVGGFFVLAALPKFLLHAQELAEFVRFGLPESSALVYLTGTIEVLGGVALVVGFLVRPAALVVATTMVGAIATAGTTVGGPFHLGVAPAMLVCCLYLVWAGAGSLSVDNRIALSTGT